MCEICKLPTASLRALNRRPSFHSQSQRTPRDDLKLAVSKIRQDATEFSELQRKLVPARARGNGYSKTPPSAPGQCPPEREATHRSPATVRRAAPMPVRTRGNSVPYCRHSRSHPRHSREGGNLSPPIRSGLDASLGIAVP